MISMSSKGTNVKTNINALNKDKTYYLVKI